jgi:hypothetical protein
MPEALLDVKLTAPLKLLKPTRLISVDESLFPRGMVTLDWLRVMPKSGAATLTSIVAEWVLTPHVQNP